MVKVGRNDPCPCGSGKKYKNCCLAGDLERAHQQANGDPFGAISGLPVNPPTVETPQAKMARIFERLAIEDPQNLDELVASGQNVVDYFEPDTALETPIELAQEKMYEAYDAPTTKEQLRLTREALDISPDCADAYVFLAETLDLNPGESLEYYEKGIAAGERALGDNFRDTYVGSFWYALETRPLMRAMAGKSATLVSLGRLGEAIEIAADLLELNPEDNQGIRYLQMATLLRNHDDVRAMNLFQDYADDISAFWLYSLALIRFRTQGDNVFARRALGVAYVSNQFVPDLLDARSLPETPPEFYAMGDESEAEWCAIDLQPAWRNTPGALDWLHSAVPRMAAHLESPNVAPWMDLPPGDGSSFFLNTSMYARWTKCPECDRPTKQRTQNLTVLIEPDETATIRMKTRFCPDCDLVIAHSDLVDAALLEIHPEESAEPIGSDVVVIGTVDANEMRNHPEGSHDATWLDEHTVRFREYRHYDDPWETMLWEETSKLTELLSEQGARFGLDLEEHDDDDTVEAQFDIMSGRSSNRGKSNTS